MKNKLQELKNKIIKEIDETKDSQLLAELKTKYLGRKGELTVILKGLKDLSAEEKPQLG